jgi:thymidylate synthase ThyX
MTLMNLRLVDDLPPEDLAMLQALQSRSAESVDAHLARVEAGGSSRFMKDYVAGYNHKSIADCGTTTVFMRGVSLLAAKAVQDWPLYCGQETSTRYIDMSQQPIVDPAGTAGSRAILDRWMRFYTENQERVAEHVAKMHPRREGEKEDKYAGAVKARTFDILRGFLPGGITTQLSWHTNLRQAGDHVSGLVHHPASEIRALGLALRRALADKYPDSGFEVSLPSVSGVPVKESALARNAWEAEVARVAAYYEPREGSAYPVNINVDRVSMHILSKKERELLETRPRGCVIPHFASRVGPVHVEGYLDFGSFRDLQRHRNGVCRMPLLTTRFGFEPWYLAQLPPSVEGQARSLIAEQEQAMKHIADPVERQYYVPLGYKVPLALTYNLPAFIYLLEMRSGKTIHPTLRHLVHGMIKHLQIFEFESDKSFGNGYALHVDMDEDDWTVRRGEQTITRRAEA